MSRPWGSRNKHHKKITPKKCKKSKKSKKYKKHLKRGRPKGSKNKVYKVKIPNEEPKKKRGRPKNPVVIIETPPASIIKKSKFLGFCPKCKSMICKNDLDGRFIFACSCGHRARIKTLKKDIGSEKFTSKKDYLNAVIDSKHVEMLPLNDVDPGNLKVIE